MKTLIPEQTLETRTEIETMPDSRLVLTVSCARVNTQGGSPRAIDNRHGNGKNG